MVTILTKFLTLWAVATLALAGRPLDNREPIEREEILDIAEGIALVQPFLKERKYFEYASAIYDASRKYGVEPEVLISITKQESAFKENLPEGKAGEMGIVQIRKIWIKNPAFRKEFPRAKVSDLKNPTKSFLFAAWILKDSRRFAAKKKENVPYWTFYNAKAHAPRLRYYAKVKRYLNSIRAGRPFYAYANQKFHESLRERYSGDVWQPAKLVLAAAGEAQWVSAAIQALSRPRTEVERRITSIGESR